MTKSAWLSTVSHDTISHPLTNTGGLLAGEMAKEVDELVFLLEREAARAVGTEPQGFRELRTGKLPTKPGSYGQYFGAVEIAGGMLRDFAWYVAYPTLAMLRANRDAKVASAMVREMFPVLINYLGYSGFPELRLYGHALIRQLDGADTDAIDRMLTAFCRYLNALYPWVYHFFPWDLGDHMRYPADTQHDAAASNPETLTPTDTVIRMRWEPVGIEVRAWLAVNDNAELCRDVLAALPFTAMQSHPMVSGESLFAWAPLVSTAPTPLKEEIRRAPVGRLRYSTRTGQKLIVQYGATSEDIMAPVLGAVLPEDCHKLPALGKAVWDSVYSSKQPVWLTVERC
jgi:hypothetical protein